MADPAANDTELARLTRAAYGLPDDCVVVVDVHEIFDTGRWRAVVVYRRGPGYPICDLSVPGTTPDDARERLAATLRRGG